MFKINKNTRLVIAGILISLSLILRFTIGMTLLTNIVMILTAVVAGTPILLNAISAAKYKIIGIDALVSIAVIGAMIIGEYWEAAAVTFLFMFGDFLESKTIEKTRSSIKALLDLAPDIARVRRDGIEVQVDPEEVVKGDFVIIKPGEKIAVDGVVVEGSAHINESAITGESMPVGKRKDDKVFSGTIIESGYLVVQADRVGEDTTFSRILQLVEEAQDSKAKTQKFLEKFSRYYTPGIIVLSIGFYLFTKDVRLALTLLVIACPGALVISTPVSIVAGIGNGAKHGVLVKGGEVMEKLGTLKVLAFDKTGTLTIGKPVVTNIKTFDIEENRFLELAAIAESFSEHPLGRAIINKAVEQNIDINGKLDDAEILTGQGLKAIIEGKTYLIGNRRLFKENNIDFEFVDEHLKYEEGKGQTVVIVGDELRILGTISIADVVRSDAKELIKNIKHLGVKKIVMLTGDNNIAAKAISEELGIDEYFGELLPEGKVEKLKNLQEIYGNIGMVGDGVNDAPALATADVGIAIGGMGTDVAMETADVVLMSTEFNKLAHAIGLSRATVNNMKQNIIFAILVAVILLLGVIVQTVNLSFGMLIHELSVILVVINAIRLLGYGKKK